MVIKFKILNELSLLLLKILVLLQLNSILSFIWGLDLLNLFLQIFESFSLLLILLFNILFLSLNSLNTFLKYLLSIFFFTLKPLLISVDGLLHLSVIVFNPLLLESNLLIFECFLSLVIDLILSILIHWLIILRFQVFNFSYQWCLFSLRFLSEFFQLLLFVLDLIVKTIFLVLKRENSSISLWYFRSQILGPLIHIFSLLREFLI